MISPKHFISSLCPFMNRIYFGLNRTALILVRFGIRADMLTLAGLIFAVLGLNFLALESYFMGFACLSFNRLCDLLDGQVARQTHITKFGAYFDIFADTTAAALLMWGFVLGNITQNAAAGCFYLTALLVSTTALLGLSSVSKQNDKSLNRSTLKICAWGALQNADIFGALLLMCLLPSYFIPIAIFFGLLLWGKTLLIISGAYWILKIQTQD